MITCEHPNDDIDRGRWRDLTESLRKNVLGANIRLHKEFVRGLELMLGKQVPSGELSSVIQNVLANVALTIESGGLDSSDLLPAMVRRAARRLIPQGVPRTEPVNAPPNAMLESLLQQLTPNQRGALEMVYVDGADDQAVCALKGLTIEELTTIRTSLRERYMTISASHGDGIEQRNSLKNFGLSRH
jgi:hypothetical protein